MAATVVKWFYHHSILWGSNGTLGRNIQSSSKFHSHKVGGWGWGITKTCQKIIILAIFSQTIQPKQLKPFSALFLVGSYIWLRGCTGKWKRNLKKNCISRQFYQLVLFCLAMKFYLSLQTSLLKSRFHFITMTVICCSNTSTISSFKMAREKFLLRQRKKIVLSLMFEGINLTFQIRHTVSKLFALLVKNLLK